MGRGVLIFEIIEIILGGRGMVIFLKVKVELFGWGRVFFFVSIHPYVKG